MLSKKNKGGFTLIELLVVISIISLLASMTFSYLGDARQKGRDTGRITAVREIRKALQLYNTEKGYFPSSLDNNPLSDYIQSIDPKIIYYGLDSENSICDSAPCSSYHLAIILEREDNMVLKSDSDKDYVFQGKSLNCSTTFNLKDLCYDLIP